MKRNQALTLVEVLVALAVGSIVVTASVSAFRAGVDHLNFSKRQLDLQSARVDWTSRLRSSLSCAFISQDTNDSKTFFIADSDNLSSDLGSTRITFTTTYNLLPGAALEPTLTFDDVHETFGPVGGIAEASYGTVPIGNAGDVTGLFERLQRPVDADPTQGGKESLVTAEILECGFSFWDGTQWLTEWDSRNGQRRLPSAVLMQYRISGADEEQTHKIVIQLAASNVTPTNPTTQAGTP